MRLSVLGLSGVGVSIVAFEVDVPECGEPGGVGGSLEFSVRKSMFEREARGFDNEGARYVTPMALCNPVISRFVVMKAMVTSPGVPVGWNAGMAKRMTVSDFVSEKGIKAQTRSGAKYFHPLIFLTAAGSAKTSVSSRSGESWRRVASWQ